MYEAMRRYLVISAAVEVVNSLSVSETYLIYLITI